MKRVLILLSILICGGAYAATETINWYMDGQTYATTTCQTGGDIILPTTPTKYGYTFQGWVEYIPIEYLEMQGNGGLNGINTGITPDGTTVFRVKLNMSSVARDAIIGYSHGSRDVYRLHNYNERIYLDYGNDSTGRVTGSQFKNNVTYDFLVGPVYVKNYETNQILVGSEQNKNFSGSLAIQIANTAKGKIYLLQIWQNNVLVRDLVPGLDKNNMPCMFDKVTHQFFYNAGTGDFTAGPVINQ